MPIVVDEVVITVDVRDERPAAPAAAAGAPPRGGSDGDRRQLVSECVERVLEILAEREER